MSHTVKVNRRGQITLPAEMRRLLDLKPGSRLRLDERGRQLILEPEGEAYGPVTASIRELFREARVGAADWELIRQWRAEGDGGG